MVLIQAMIKKFFLPLKRHLPQMSCPQSMILGTVSWLATRSLVKATEQPGQRQGHNEVMVRVRAEATRSKRGRIKVDD